MGETFTEKKIKSSNSVFATVNDKQYKINVQNTKKLLEKNLI